ncbi:MAG: hypothetical protein KOO60_07070 [Gemmatimonadales bacterium]|nr:hypothetical protein [Gemmatimonadales bacterium]
MGIISHYFRINPKLQNPAVLFLLFFLVCPASDSFAQMLNLDPIPWSVPADSTSSQAFIIEVARFEETTFDWAADRLQLTLILPAGLKGTYFLRMPHITFDKGDIPLFSRWPGVQGEAVVDTFWTENRVSSFGQIEAGANSWVDWPLVGRIHYGGAIGLPVGSDRLYPISSVSFPLRGEIRKDLELVPGVHLALSAGSLYNLDSGSDLLDPQAFPNGQRWGAALSLYGGPNRRIVLDYDQQNREGRRSTLVGLQGWLPWSDDGSWGLRVDRQLGGSIDSCATWRVALSWRFDNARHRPGYEEPDPELSLEK